MNYSNSSMTIPPNLVAYAGFPVMLSHCFEKLENYRFDCGLMPWNITKGIEKILKRCGEADYDQDIGSSILLLNSYVTTLTQYTVQTLPEADKEIESLDNERRVLYTGNNYTDNEQTEVLRAKCVEIRNRFPHISWLVYSSLRDRHELQFDVFYSKDAFVFCNGAMITIMWTLMKAGIFNIDYFSDALLEQIGGFMPLDDFAAWDPMFSVHRVDNSSFCEFTQFGQEVQNQDETNHWLVCNHEDDCCSESFTCFLSQGNINWWMKSFKDWGYTRESAIEFFGVKGFFSNLFASVNFDADFLHKDPVFAKAYIDGVVIPLFDEYFPVPILASEPAPVVKAKKKSTGAKTKKAPSNKKKK
jgi:hypothetical protein